MKKKMELCAKCTALIADAYDVRRIAGGVDYKVTCEHCRKRRFGGTYEVETRAKREK